LRNVWFRPLLGITSQSQNGRVSAFGSAARTGTPDYVFATATGHLLDRRNVRRRGLDTALERVGLVDPERPVIRSYDTCGTPRQHPHRRRQQRGHGGSSAGPCEARHHLAVYAHLFDKAENADRLRSTMQARFGTILA